MIAKKSSPPKELHVFLDDAHALIKAGHQKTVYDKASRWVTLYPKNSTLHTILAKAAISLKQFPLGISHLEDALEHEPKHANLHLELAHAKIIMGHWIEAETILDKAVNLSQNDAAILEMAGASYSMCNYHEKAKNCFTKALQQDPDNITLHYNIGTRHRFLGETEEAEKSFEKVLSLSPYNAEVVYLLSNMRRQTQHSNHIDYIKQGIAQSQDNAFSQSILYYALAKEYEDLKDWDSAFKALNQGAGLRRSTITYNGRTHVNVLKKTTKLFTKNYLSSPTVSCKDKGPIFIVGMPRTGSTLVDTIISSHQKIFSAGELDDFSDHLKFQLKKAAARHPERAKDKLALAKDIDFKELGRGYLDSVKSKIGDHEYFTDKLPLNFQYCGLIKRALPNARIIHVFRDPMDSCYSIYKAFFRTPYPHSYNLTELAEYFVAYYQLMQHWHAALPGQILDVRYEDVVEDYETQARKMIDFCDLEWDPQCLNYRKTKAAITTLSASQVRSKIYSSSIGKWKHFEEDMAPALKILQEAGLPHLS